jgi:hypothetical protein
LFFVFKIRPSIFCTGWPQTMTLIAVLPTQLKLQMWASMPALLVDAWPQTGILPISTSFVSEINRYVPPHLAFHHSFWLISSKDLNSLSAVLMTTVIKLGTHNYQSWWYVFIHLAIWPIFWWIQIIWYILATVLTILVCLCSQHTCVIFLIFWIRRPNEVFCNASICFSSKLLFKI